MKYRAIATLLLCSLVAERAIGAGGWQRPTGAEPSPAALCALYQLDREYEHAVRMCTDALHDGEDAEVYSNRGSAYLMLHQLDRAISDFDRAIELEPDNAIRYYNRGAAFSMKQEGRRAIDDYSVAIRLGPGLAPAYSNRAREYELAGERDKAIADYRAALRLAPELKRIIEGHLKRLDAPR
jgi:tetratricopeptide (TPR) repeat protein